MTQVLYTFSNHLNYRFLFGFERSTSSLLCDIWSLVIWMWRAPHSLMCLVSSGFLAEPHSLSSLLPDYGYCDRALISSCLPFLPVGCIPLNCQPKQSLCPSWCFLSGIWYNLWTIKVLGVDTSVKLSNLCFVQSKKALKLMLLWVPNYKVMSN